MKTCFAVIVTTCLLASPAKAQDLLNRVKQLEDAITQNQKDVAQIKSDLASLKADVADMKARMTAPAQAVTPASVLGAGTVTACGVGGCSTVATTYSDGTVVYASAAEDDSSSSGRQRRCGPLRRLLGRCK